MITVRCAMRRAATMNADRLAVVCGDRQLTFAEAWDRGLRMANALLDLGLEPQDRVAVLEDNSIEAADFFLGTAAANLVRVPLYKRNSPESHAHMVRHTGCRALVVSESLLPEIADIKAAVPELEHVIVRSERDYESWLAGQKNTDPDPDISFDDYYIIRHSGGTTGRPKGMAFTHRSWMMTERDWTYRLPPIEAGDACIHVAPISHGSGYLFVPIWLAGGYNVLEKKFEAERFLDLLSTHGGYAFAVPTIVSDIVTQQKKEDKKRNFDKLKAIPIAGAPIRETTAREAHAVFGDRLHQFFGQTEAVPVSWMTSREWFDEVPGSSPVNSVGRPMPFAQVEIRDEETNEPLPVGEQGEIAVQVDGQITSIWNEPELTAQRIVDGWILTGDIGYLDQNGYLYLVDRKDDLIISGGFNIWPAELEIAIASHPNVREVVVVSAPHERFGETPAAIVVLHEGKTLKEEDVVTLCAEKLGGYKRPGVVVLQYEPLPRTPVGKFPRKTIRERFWGSEKGRLGGS